MNTRNISFSEKKVSKNAVITLVMGIIILIGFVILTIWGINWLYPHDSCIFLCSLGRNELR